ncbi:ATP-binding cassette domain-containing protein [Sphingobacterium sp. SGG-5]|uniref:ABC transporter ATP-binding protein n=1 Tax=Sphingobacterium sp. SGG-5 TaxID=2710881 RepID=UPI0013ED5AA2|nr:polysaccharide ABC transporter ATP-binding protein [Sphingobacterium sp. SGG-5]NGM63435.1 ATP-binding cassette domain-containing protein [Sphingobacterium sp. SGG-5]
MNDIILKAENVSKQYRLGKVGTGTLSHDLNRLWHRMRGKEDPYLKIGEVNDRAQKGSSDYVWALKDVNFEIQQGDAVGIIGRNGAGKSTLLKLLSRVTKPTTGSIRYKGRIASLLEVGTGFHPEMTGRENIYLNGAILGMTRKEINRKFDEIVDFSGVERYIDTPVKRYSSGMYVRLAFAVAAHLESEILIVDEVLAVGDAEFQKKCLGKMGDVSKGEGRTVLFVSHNMAAVKTLCNQGVLMRNGTIASQGNIQKVLDRYVSSDSKSINVFTYIEDKAKEVQIIGVRMVSKDGVVNKEFAHDEQIKFEIKILCRKYQNQMRVNVAILDCYDNVLFINRFNLKEGLNEFIATLNGSVLIAGVYKLSVAVDVPNIGLFDFIDGGVRFEIVDTGDQIRINGDTNNGIIVSPLIWQ